MPKEPEHLALAAHNQDTIDFLLTGGDRFPDWVATVAFYKALHLIDAMLDRDLGIDGVDHSRRRSILKHENRYKTIYGHYKALEEASTIARYLACPTGAAYKTFTDYLSPSQVKQQLLDHRLASIEKSIAGLRRIK
jgi:hypothetical protein